MDISRKSTGLNSVYNTVGSVFFCFCQWLLTLIVVRLSGDYENAGLFQLVITVTNAFYLIACFNVRPFQVSDEKNEYTSGLYIATRVVTSVLSLVVCIVYSALSGYSFAVVLCITFYFFAKLSEAFSDVFQGIQQNHGNLKYTLVSFVSRGLLTVLSFSAVFILTKSLMLALLVMGIVLLLFVFVYDRSVTCRFEKYKVLFDRERIKSLIKACFPTVVSSLLLILIVSIPRQCLEKQVGTNMFGIYATVATPIVIVQLLSTSVFTTYLSDMALYLENKDFKKFYNLIVKMVLILIAGALVVLLAGRLIGTQCYVLVYGESIRPYCYLMYPIIICSCLYALAWLFINIFVVRREMIETFVVSSIGFAGALSVMKYFIGKFGLNGASYSIIVGYCILIVSSFILLLINKRKDSLF